MARNRHENSSGETVLANHQGFPEQNAVQIAVSNLTWDAKQQCRVLQRKRRRCVQSSWGQKTGATAQMGQRNHVACARTRLRTRDISKDASSTSEDRGRIRTFGRNERYRSLIARCLFLSQVRPMSHSS